MTPTPANDFGGAELIARERERQKSAEGWTEEHDAGHSDGELAAAAECYLLELRERRFREGGRPGTTTRNWPWHHRYWKPTEDPIRQLVKAGALIAAEIDRLKRREADV